LREIFTRIDIWFEGRPKTIRESASSIRKVDSYSVDLF
jgi:hypothetical protein